MSSAYIGNRVQNVDIGEELDKVTRVVLVVDSDHVYTAGNDTGRTIEREIPWGSQAMADSLLRKLSGVAYKPFNAERAIISPAFEIGDPVTVGGVYSRIIGADINYGISGLVDIYAPDLDVTEDEYPSEKTQQSSIERQLAGVRSSITKTADQIRLEVFGEDGYTGSSITMQLDKIRTEVIGELYDENGNPISVASAISQTASDILLNVEGALGTDEEGNLMSVSNSIEVALSGIKLSATSEDGETTLTLTAGGGVKIESSFANLTQADLGKDGTTTIYGGLIDTDSIFAESLHLGGALTIYRSEYGSNIGGYLGYDSGYYGNTNGIGIRSENEYSQLVCTNWAARMSYTDDGDHLTQVVCGQELALSSVGSIQFSIGGNVANVVASLESDAFYTYDDTITLGKPGWEWSDVYAAGTSMSDLLERVKTLEGA